MFRVPHKVLKTAEVRIPMPGTEEQEVPKLEDVLFELFDEDRQYMYIGSENLENPHPQPQLQSEPQSEPQPQFQPQSQPKPQFQPQSQLQSQLQLQPQPQFSNPDFPEVFN